MATEDPAVARDELRASLTREAGPCLASDLLAHLERGVVIFVEDELDLVEAALSIACDDTETVKNWIESGRLRRASAADDASLRATPEIPYTSVIVRPWVLAQKISTGAS